MIDTSGRPVGEVFVALRIPNPDGSGQFKLLGVYNERRDAEARCWRDLDNFQPGEFSGEVLRCIIDAEEESENNRVVDFNGENGIHHQLVIDGATATVTCRNACVGQMSRRPFLTKEAEWWARQVIFDHMPFCGQLSEKFRKDYLRNLERRSNR